MSETEQPFQAPAIDSVGVEIGHLQSDWPVEIRSRANNASVYFHLPSLLGGAFPRLDAERLLPLLSFCRLYAESILWQDKIVDGTPADEPAATTTLRIMLMQAEAYRLLHRMFPPGARFWDRFRGYLLDHASACLLERQFVSGERPFGECTDEVRRRIVLGKNGLARSIAAGLVELSGDEDLYEPLVDVVNAFNMATQIWDDLEDWKDDARRGVPTFVVSRLLASPPGDVDDAQWKSIVARLSRELYYRGHAEAVLSLVLTSIDAAERHMDVLPGLGLYDKTKALRLRCEGLKQDIERIVRANLARAPARPGAVKTVGA